MGKTLNEFIKYLESRVDRAIYVWGAQTQVIKNGKVYSNDSFKKILSGTVTPWVKKMETSTTYKNQAINLYKKRKDKFKEIPCHDCSGLGMNWIQNETGLSKTDMTANGMLAKCTKIKKSQLAKGDWVFQTKNGKAHHIGYVVDNDLNVVHSKGRRWGVIKEAFSSKTWDTYGRPKYFKEEIELLIEVKDAMFELKRELKKGCTGNDVKELQTMLNEAMDAGLAVDGSFGTKTYKAVRKYQKAKGLKIDGIVGEKTITALGGVWKD